MNSSARASLRLATIARLAKQVDVRGGFGRTALMKLAYFLQTIRDVPLGYQFRLYTYGPYDGQVLEDLKTAEVSGAVRSTVVYYPVGPGYLIKSAETSDEVIARSPDLARYTDAIDAVASEFAARSAIDLEMASTVVFVDREEAERGQRVTPSQVAAKVKEIKPRLDLARIAQEATSLRDKGYLRATA